MRIAKNIKSFTDIIPNNVKLVAVSKTKSINLIESAYKAGQRDFGENKVQELVDKFENLPKDINWHMICLLYTSPSPRDVEESRMPSSA